MGSSVSQAPAKPNVQLAGAIVIHAGQVLIVQRSRKERFLPGQWGIPCGKVDVQMGEAPAEAVLRELKEETGVSGEVIEEVGSQSFVSSLGVNRQTNFLVRPLRSEQPRVSFHRHELPAVVTPEQDQRWQWLDLTLAEDPQTGLDEYNRRAIRQGIAHLRPAG